MAPADLYDGYDREGGPLYRYVFLIREDRSDLHISDLSPARAAAMSVCVMQAEYAGFHNHLHWHAVNRAAEDRLPTVSVTEVLKRWQEVLTRVLDQTSCQLARIPRSMEHGAFRRRMAGLLVEAG